MTGQQWVETAGLRLFVRTWGVPRGRGLLFWHGLSYTGRASLTLNEAGPLLASKHGLYVVAFDVPGFGRSPATGRDGYHPHALAALVPALLDELALERVAFMGHSWGGHIGCHVAARHAERLVALVLLDSGYRDPWYDPSEPFATRLAECERAWEAQAEDGLVPAVSPAVMAAVVHGLAQAPPSTTWPALGRSALPVLLVAAGDTADEDLAPFTAAVPHAAIHRAAGVGHDVLNDGGPAVLDVVGDWLAQTTADP